MTYSWEYKLGTSFKEVKEWLLNENYNSSSYQFAAPTPWTANEYFVKKELKDFVIR